MQRDERESWQLGVMVACVAIVLGLMLMARCAEARPPCAPEVKLRRAQLHHHGLPGIWFDIRVARCLLADLEAASKQPAVIDALERKQVALSRKLAIVGKDRDLLARQLSDYTARLTAADRARAEAERQRDAWWRHPAIWASGGAAVATGLAIAIAIATR